MSPDPRKPFGRNVGRDPRLALIVRMASLVALLLAGSVHPGRAQAGPVVVAVSDTVVEIRLSEGSIIYGRIVAIEGDRITIEMESGTRIDVNRPQILSIRRTSSRMVHG